MRHACSWYEGEEISATTIGETARSRLGQIWSLATNALFFLNGLVSTFKRRDRIRATRRPVRGTIRTNQVAVINRQMQTIAVFLQAWQWTWHMRYMQMPD